VRASVSGGGLDVSLLGLGYLDRFARIEIEGDVMRLER
jgi:predicted aspartyl protease